MARKATWASAASRVTRLRSPSMSLASFSSACCIVSSLPCTNSTSLGIVAPCFSMVGSRSPTSWHIFIWLRMCLSIASIWLRISSAQLSNFVVGRRLLTSTFTPGITVLVAVLCCSGCVVCAGAGWPKRERVGF